ncbi:MAG: PAS domain S-box protein [Nitrospirae bacterium]|nr:PAS domain S-box protein [Nitrospirota bacterium]
MSSYNQSDSSVGITHPLSAYVPAEHLHSDDLFSHTVTGCTEQQIVVVGKDLKVRYMNHAARAAAGLRDDDTGPYYCYRVTHHRDKPCDTLGESCPVKEVFRTGRPVIEHHEYFDGKNKESLLEIYAFPIFDENGEVSEVTELIREVTKKELAKKVQFSEERFRSLVESTPDAIITADSNGIAVSCNSAVKKIFGYTPGELSGKPVTMIIPERFHEKHAEGIRMVREGRKPMLAGKTIELVALKKDGTEFPVELSLSAWRSKGETYFTAIIRDITIRKSYEASLLEEKQRLELTQKELMKKHEELNALFRHVEIAKKEWERTADCLDDMIILADSEGNIKRCNKSVKEFTGLSYEELLGRNWEGLLSEYGIEAYTLYRHSVELRHKPTDRYFVLKFYPFQALNSYEDPGIVITIHDFTELKRAAESLEKKNREIDENRRKLQAALDEISALIQKVAHEKDFSIRFSNPNLKTCYEEMECTVKDCRCHGQEATRCWRIVGTECEGEVQGFFAKKYGDCKHCPVFKCATADPIYVIGEHFNNMMHILESQNRELETAYTELKATQTKILQQEKMASIGQLAAGVAHEINNPIGFISSNLGTLDKYVGKLTEFIEFQAQLISSVDSEDFGAVLGEKRRKLKLDYVIPDIKALIEESLDGADRVRKIVQDLKSFSRVDEAEYKHADINECIESTINIVWNELKYKAVLKKEFGELPLTKCYPQQLNQVFMNLLVNAAHAIEKQGEITINTRHEDDSIFVAISDTGVGIPEENLSRIFDPFFTTKEIGKGTGLGLSITYDIVKKHNGDISVHSEPGKGTTFTVRIPVVDGR